MTISGSLLSEIEFAPRIRILVPVPVVPELGRIATPAALPWSRLATLVTGLYITTESARTCVMACPSSSFRCSPVAVMTISSRLKTTADSAKSAVARSLAATVTVFLAAE